MAVVGLFALGDSMYLAYEGKIKNQKILKSPKTPWYFPLGGQCDAFAHFPHTGHRRTVPALVRSFEPAGSADGGALLHPGFPGMSRAIVLS